MARRVLPPIALLAAILHGVGIARSSLPAQDGLKFLRVARDFHARPWGEVVRASDQHPLYPACIAMVQPVLACVAGTGADSWRLAAQVVSAAASIATILPLYGLTRRLFGPAPAALASLMFALLPFPSEIGHDTLADSLGLLALTSTLWLGLEAQATGRMAPAIGCGVAAGLGYLARPEVAVAAVSVVIATMVRSLARREVLGRCVPSITVVFLASVGSYALVKGEVSEKLALRNAVALAPSHDASTRAATRLPAGLDGTRWDFSAKEESTADRCSGAWQATVRLASRWSESIGFGPVPLVVLGAWVGRKFRGVATVGLYAALFAAALLRNATAFGYLSSRHTLSLVVAALPFAALGLTTCVRTVARWREHRGPGSVRRRLAPRIAAVTLLVTLGVAVQVGRSPHVSRWGHGEAGSWLQCHSRPGESVLDTRGWASFVSGRPSHDYWHVGQALADPNLGFLVVGDDELSASSGRAKTLRALIAHAAIPAASFPGRPDGGGTVVHVFRIRPTVDWRGMWP